MAEGRAQQEPPVRCKHLANRQNNPRARARQRAKLLPAPPSLCSNQRKSDNSHPHKRKQEAGDREAGRLRQWRQGKTTPQIQGAEDIPSRRHTQEEPELFSNISMTPQNEGEP